MKVSFILSMVMEFLVEPNPFQKQLQVSYVTLPELIANFDPYLPIPPSAFASYKKIPKPTHDAAYWAAVTKGLDFSREDRVDPDRFNRIVWQGLKCNVPYPTERNGADLRRNRRELLQSAGLINLSDSENRNR